MLVRPVYPGQFTNFTIVFKQVGKISLYAASSAIKEVQKLVLDPK